MIWRCSKKLQTNKFSSYSTTLQLEADNSKTNTGTITKGKVDLKTRHY